MSERRDPLFDWITRDDQHDDVFYVAHAECNGRFRMCKPSFGRDLELEQLKSAIQGGPHPTEVAQMFAEQAATIRVGIVEGPTVGEEPELELYDVVDHKLIQGIYAEVVAYWATFRAA